MWLRKQWREGEYLPPHPDGQAATTLIILFRAVANSIIIETYTYKWKGNFEVQFRKKILSHILWENSKYEIIYMSTN